MRIKLHSGSNFATKIRSVGPPIVYPDLDVPKSYHISVGAGNIDFRSQGPGLRVDRERCETPYRRNGGFRRLRQ
jgi:hypothetical protein